MVKKFDLGNLNQLQLFLDDLITDLDDVVSESVKKLAEQGKQSIDTKMANAIYDGTASWETHAEVDGNKATVGASGDKVAFIEFGTGVTYPDDHPKAKEMGAIRGEYGQGKGKNPSWIYYGEPGSNGKDLGNGFVETSGNPANKPIYNTMKELEESIQTIVTEEMEKLGT